MKSRDCMHELIAICSKMKDKLETLNDENYSKTLVMKHFKSFSNVSVEMPDFDKGLEWFNVSEALSLNQQLKGKIVLLDFFTYCCINCMHVIAELEQIEEQITIEDGFVIIGIHSAKFPNEQNAANVSSAIQKYHISHPVINDVTLNTWKTLGVLCWPTLILLGPNGKMLAAFVGEGHKDEILLYTKAAIEYYQNEISDHTLPLQLEHHVSSNSADRLFFPGKIEVLSFEEELKLVISDTGNNRILITNEEGKVLNTIGGCSQGFEDGNFENARFNSPQGLCVLKDMIYVADTNNHAIRLIDLNQSRVCTVAGTGIHGHDYSGGKRGNQQILSSPWDVAIYNYRYKDTIKPVLLIAVAGVHQIWAVFLENTTWWRESVYTEGTCIAIVGTGREENRNNFYPHSAGLAQPSGIVVIDEYKLAFWVDSESSSIRKLNLENGQVSPVCGAEINPANLQCFGDRDGNGYTVKLQHPLGIAWNHSNKLLYVADTYNHKIKTVDFTKGLCRTLFGDGQPDSTFFFKEPGGLAINPNGKILYVADTNNHSIKVIDLEKKAVLITNVIFKLDIDQEFGETFVFDTTISTKGGLLNITLNLVFMNDWKLSANVPQKWLISLPVDTWTTKALIGNLSEPISVKLPYDDTCHKLRLILNIMTCTKTACMSRELLVIFRVHRIRDAPTVVIEKKNLFIK